MPIDSTPSHVMTLRRGFLRDIDPGEPTEEQPREEAHAGPASRQTVIDAYCQGIKTLQAVLDIDGEAPPRARLKLQQFAEFVAGGIRDGFQDDVRDQFMNQAHQDFALFCTLVQKPNLPEDARRQAILRLTEGVDVCAPAVAQHIEAATRELQALTSVAQNFAHRLTTAVEQQIQEFIRRHQVCKHAGNEIHYVALFFNQVADAFGLPQRTDALLPKDVAQTVLDAGARHVFDAAPVERVITLMAEDYLARIEDFHASQQQNLRAASLDLLAFDALHRKFHAELKPRLDSMFGPVEDSVLFTPSITSAEERYGLTTDITLIARAIARNLRAADVIAFKPAYVLGAPGEGIKLKQLGQSLFYASETQPNPSADAASAGRNLHLYQTLDRFVLEDLERGRQMLKQLDQLALAPASMQAAKAAQEDFWEKMPASVYREMKDAPGPQEATRIVRQTMALLASDAARNRFALALLKQAASEDPPYIIDAIFRALSQKALAVDEQHCHTVLELALKLGNARFATEFIPQIPPAVLSVQDDQGYTLLMHALECHQTEAARLLIHSMSPEQLSLQEHAGNTALGGALIMEQAALASAIIDKLDAKQLNLQNANGDTALMLALPRRQTENAKHIIDKSGREQLLLRNQEGETARAIALRCKEAEIAQFLKEKSSRWLSWLYRH